MLSRHSLGSFLPFDDDESFAERIKGLQYDELLDVWLETQQIERMLKRDVDPSAELAPEYEAMILDELRLRSTRRLLPRIAR